MKKAPERCLDCRSFWTGGKKDGKHDRWCCHFGNVASKVQAQCIQSGAKKEKNADQAR